MKLGDDVLLCIMEALRKGLTESVDISELLREIDLVEDGNGKLKLAVPLKDIWTVSEAEMAIHVFECPKCKIRIELQRSIKDETVPLCCEENCNAIEMEQIIVASNFHLKGLGWAAEGYSKTGVD